ncbi:hypothetical protein [Pedobacter sp. ASV12]|uniref:hypothetical protein n=1 Tax=Pedobacter sp. ASV12 TaxID=2795120 RepID=UPI0018EAE4DC|nr:hypothetical protein [Pedobacter sp. ASV12]
MLNYNIYDHISDEDFLKIENKLVIIERIMMDKLMALAWRLTKSVKENDALIVDFTTEEKKFMGNLGLVYIDEVGGPIFSFYLSKSYDGSKKRFFVKQFIYQNQSIEFYERNINSILDEAISLYNLWNKEYICNNSCDD